MEQERIINKIVQRKNSILSFIFLLVVTLFFYIVVSMSAFSFIRFWGEIIALLVFIISLGGLFVSLSEQTSVSSRAYYVGLFIVSGILIVFVIYSGGVSTILKYFYMLAVLVALFIALIDIRQYNEEIRIIRNYYAGMQKAKSELEEINNELSKANGKLDSYKLEIEKYKDRIGEKTAQAKQAESSLALEEKKIRQLEQSQKLLLKRIETSHVETEKYKKEMQKKAALAKEAEKKVEALQNQANDINAQLLESQDSLITSEQKIMELNERNKKLRKDKEKVSELKEVQSALEREIERRKKETEAQAILKRQYSKTLRSIRKHKKEDAELLVVSPDGKSVHRPKCISVRHIPKESRKLIKNWATAKKEKYIGCKLCKPHIKAQVVMKNNINYKLVGSKNADKIHKVSCTLARNIDGKDRVYFRTYRAALKKGFTACRVCNPEQ